MDLTCPVINNELLPVMNWKEFYGEVTEPIPPNALKPLGKQVDVYITVLVDWHSKLQAMIETGVIDAEFVAMKTGVDRLRALRNKFRMMGVAVDGATHI
ncbi:hypothetical protein ACHAXS_000444 [Conticribra weissflogii]